MYGNVFAISFWTVILFIWHHRNLRKHITAEHEKSRAHVSAAIPLSSEKEA
jgi:hypothetical protein